MITSFGFHYTFIADQTFILGQEYEQRITSTSNGNSSAVGGNLPEIDGIVDGEPVVYGDVQPTNPMMDYEELNHLPKINGNTLIGNMSNAQLGIPTALADLTDDATHRVVTDEQVTYWNNKVTDAHYVHTDNNYTTEEKNKLFNIPTLGTAATKNYTYYVTESSGELVTSGAVHEAIEGAIASVYKPAGNKTCAELVSSLLVASNLGKVFNMTDSGITTADFVEGAGKPINAGDNIAIVDVGNSTYKFDILTGMVDLSNYVQKSATSGLIKNDGSIDTTAYAKQNEMSVSASGDRTTIQLKSGTSAEVLNAHQDISGKANKSEMFITDGTGANADKTTIQLKDGLSKAVLIAHQDISGKAEKSEMSVTDGTGTDADKTTIQLKSETSATVLKTHQDISGKADKVSGATNGNLAGLDANGNLTDSGIAKTDVEEMQDELSIDTSTIEGNPINFSTKSAQNATSTLIDLEPIQDLHGYDNPWVGGAGKNKLPLVLADIKSYNTNGTWTDNVYVTDDGLTFTILTDSAENVIGIKIQGTNGNSQNRLRIITDNDNSCPFNGYILNGCDNGGGSSTYDLRVSDTVSVSNSDTGSGVTIALNNTGKWYCAIIIKANVQMSNVMFYPMIRLSTETDATFQPYTNECGISGRTEIGILGCGKNLLSDGTNTNNGYVQSTYLNSSGEEIYNTGWNINEYFRVEPNTSYVWSNTKGNVSNNVCVCFYDKNKQYISGINHSTSPKIMTTPSNAVYARGCSYSDTSSLGFNQIEKNNQATQYTAYQSSNDLTISLGQTVYGGTLDVENGVLVVDKEIFSVSGTDINSVNTEGNMFRVFLNSRKYTITSAYPNNAISDKYVVGTSYGDVNNNNGRFALNDTSNGSVLLIRDDSQTSTSLITYLTSSPLQICYELATPITINLTPHTINLLKDVNNISTDGDKITLTYRDGSVATLGDLLEVEKKIPSVTAQHNYSTEEQVVGKWIDGKPLYEKCFTNVAKDTQILSGVDTVVDFRVSSHGIGENADYHVIGDGFSTNSSKVFTLISGDVVFTSWTSTGTDMEKSADFIVIQYTKITD